MILNKYIKVYQDLTEKASDLTRKLAFGGIAIIWIFIISDSSGLKIPHQLTLPILFFASTLIFDLCHYIYGGIAYYILYKLKSKKYQQNENVEKPKYLNIPMEIFYFLKLISVILGYIFLIIFLIAKIQVA
ncbi:MAG: hypothetical protein IIA49_14810 [Bacteroidetes bacterium]|nr:hypothetical protein [Bacteroidota bacterium]